MHRILLFQFHFSMVNCHRSNSSFCTTSFEARLQAVNSAMATHPCVVINGVTVFNTLIYLAAHTTSAFNLSLFAITAPIYVVFFNWMFYKEIITRNQTIGFIILLVGLLVLLSKGNPEKFLNLNLTEEIYGWR